MRLRARQRAARIEDIATAYGGCQSQEGIDGLQRHIEQLLKD